MKESCSHMHRHTVHSPDDGGYYVECLDCWKTGPVAKTPKEAARLFYYDRKNDPPYGKKVQMSEVDKRALSELNKRLCKKLFRGVAQ